MMLNTLRHKISIILKCDALIIRVVVFPYNYISLNNYDLRMYRHNRQKQFEFFGEEDMFQLEKSKRCMDGYHFDLKNHVQDVNLQDFISNKFAPNISTASISTLSNVSYENYDIQEDFFINDCLQEEPKPQFKPQAAAICQLQPALTVIKSTPEGGQVKVEAMVQMSENHQEGQITESRHDQTKNIPKNYIKAIFTFILQNSQYLQEMFKSINGSTSDASKEVHNFIEYVRNQKKTKRYTIQRLKSLWLNQSNGKAMRIVSNQFFRKRALGYISGSKIEKKMQHIKYRHKFISAVQKPAQFCNIK